MPDWFDRYAPSESRSLRIVVLLAGALSLDMILEGTSVLTGGLVRGGGPGSILAHGGVLVHATDIVTAWTVLLVGIIGLVASLTLIRGSGSAADEKDDAKNPENPITALQTRYAEGELSDEEFERRLASLLESDEYRDGSERHRAEKLLE